MQTDSWQFDPRPDLADDSAAWHHLLMHAKAVGGACPEGLYGSLHGMRCLGARLAIVNGRARLFRGEISESDYAVLRDKWLMPHREKLVSMLEMLERWIDRDANKRSGASDEAAS